MNVIAEIEKLPPHVQQEVFDYIEFLINKYNDEKTNPELWIKNIKRGKSIGESASETNVKLRGESEW
jgi:hypothetical protein